MRLTRYGHREIVWMTVLLMAVMVLNALTLAKMTDWSWIIVGLVGVVWLWTLWFFRDPERPTPTGEGLFISPADGTVADITPLGTESALGCDGVQIGVFMSVFSVHVNRAPCDAVVEDVIHQEGLFLDARDPAASERNESVTLRLRYTHNGQEYPVLVRQIAGLVARRIVAGVKSGDTLKRGERFGMIKFGSRLELLLPEALAGEVCVRLGQKVQAGLTVLARSAETQARDCTPQEPQDD